MSVNSIFAAAAVVGLAFAMSPSQRAYGAAELRARTSAPAVNAQPMEKQLMSFDDPAVARRWSISSDAVMGGISTSRARIDASGTLVFFGEVRLEYNGGFATVTGAAPQGGDDLTGFERIAMRVKGDGKTYQLWLYTGSRRRVHVARFTTTPNTWETIVIPFSAFRGENGFGQPVLTSKLVDPTVLGYRLLISDKQKGPFELHVDWIRAVE